MSNDDLWKQEKIDLDRINDIERERNQDRAQRDYDDDRIRDIEREKQDSAE